jgi:hypothetical protein
VVLPSLTQGLGDAYHFEVAAFRRPQHLVLGDREATGNTVESNAV